jgi:hypothetical protein
MAEATFQPATAPGEITRDYNAGFDRSVSMMQRAALFRQQEQLNQQQIEANKVLAPLHEAEAQAKIVGAGAAIANNTRVAQLRTQAALASKPAQDEYLDATGLADWNEQELALGRLQAKYAWMGNVPEYKGFLDTVDKARSNALKRSLLDQQIEEAHFRAETAAQARVDAAATAADARTYSSDNSLEGRKYAADANATSRVESTTIAAGSRSASSAANRDARATEDEYKASQRAAIVADQNAAKASMAGNEEEAAQHRKQAEQFRQQAQAVHQKPAEPMKFTVPGLNGAPEKPTQKLYTAPAKPGEAPQFSPAVKTPQDVLSAMQQMVDAGVIDADQARETLTKLGFKPKGK